MPSPPPGSWRRLPSGNRSARTVFNGHAIHRRSDAMAKAQSKKQQMAAGAALSAKRGEKPKSSLKGASKSMAESMSRKELEDMAGTKRKNLPQTKSDD